MIRFRRSPWLLPVLLVALLSLSGCVTMDDPEVSQDFRAGVVATLSPGVDVWQSLDVRRPDFNQVQVWLRKEPGAGQPSGNIQFELWYDPQDANPLVSLAVNAANAEGGGPVTFRFPPQPDSARRTYFIRLSTTGSVLQVSGRNEDAYPAGELSIGSAAQDADIAFRTGYDYGSSNFALDLQTARSGIWVAIPLLLVLWLPGRVLLSLTRFDRKIEWGQRTALSVGLSLSITPVLMTWTSLLHLRWSQAALWIGCLLLVIVLAWRWLQAWRGGEKRSVSSQSPAIEASISDATITSGWQNLLVQGVLGLAFLLALAVRLVMVRDLAAPPWVDSVHHALLARLVQDSGGFPSSLAPYLAIPPGNYHLGLHAVIAAFDWLSGLAVIDGLLLLGQVLNALHVFGAYALARSLTGSRLAGLFAGVIAGLFTPMPAYYTSWGRYTELAGLLVLPAAVSLTLDAARSAGKPPWRGVLLAAVSIAGVFLTHYRVLAFLAALLIAWLAVEAAQALLSRRFREMFRQKTGAVAAAGLGAALLVFPWLPAAASTLLLPRLGQAGAFKNPWFYDFSWSYLNAGLGQYTLYLAAAGLLLALLLRRPFALVVPLWVAVMFLLANLGALSLPGAGFINNTSVAIALYLPIALLGGWALAALVEFGSRWLAARRLPARLQPAALAALFIAGLFIALAGARSLVTILNPVTVLFHQADRPAMVWITQNIPQGETILVNPFNWGYGIYAGSDGGYWISSLASHPTMPPPVLYGIVNEMADKMPISDVAKQVLALSNQPEALHDYLLSQNIHYIYLGAKGGALSPKLLSESEGYQAIYRGEGTWVFTIKP